jgi:hypothetical protein
MGLWNIITTINVGDRMSYRLGGRNALAYVGVEPTQPPQMLVINHPPTPSDNQNFNIGTFWIVPNPPSNPEQVWVLVSLAGGVAHWVQLYPTSAASLTFDTDSGTAEPLAGVINVLGGASTAGTNIDTTGSGNTVDVILNDSLFFPNTNSAGTEGVLYWGGQRFVHNFGFVNNTFVGSDAGNFTMNHTSSNIASGNVGIGAFALSSLVGSALNDAENNVGIGAAALASVTDGSWNTAVGHAGLSLTTGQGNIFVGNRSGENLLTGSTNVLIGTDDNLGATSPGVNYTGAESNNLIFGNAAGITGENNVMRLGDDGTGVGLQNTCYLAGVYAQTVTTGTTKIVVQDSTFKLGGSTITSSDASILITITAGNIDLKVA